MLGVPKDKSKSLSLTVSTAHMLGVVFAFPFVDRLGRRALLFTGYGGWLAGWLTNSSIV